MSVGHYESVRRLALEVEARTPYVVTIDHKNARLFVGPEFSSWGVWSTTLFDGQGMARRFESWRDGRGPDQVVRLAMLSQRRGKDKAKWATRKRAADTKHLAAQEEARVQSHRAFDNLGKRRGYSHCMA